MSEVQRILGQKEGADPLDSLAQSRVGRLLGGEATQTPQPAESFWGKMADYAKAAPGAVKSMVTGEGRAEFDIPEYRPALTGQQGLEGLQMLGAYATSSDPQQIADIAVKALPGSSASVDAMGNPILTFEGQDYYINKPGLSAADAIQLLSQAAAYTPAARSGLASRSMTGRAWRVGSRSSGTSVALDTASTALGSEQGISGERAATAFAFGAGFELLSPVAKAAWRKIASRDDLFDPATKTLTDRGKKLAEAAGLDPEDIAPDLAGEFAKQARDEPFPKVAGAKALTKKHGIQYSTGQQTGDPAQQGLEEGIRHGAFGGEGQAGMRAFDKGQTEQSKTAIKNVQARLGKAGVTAEAEGGEALQQGLMREALKLDRRIDDAYALARSTEASIKNPSSFDSLAKAVVEEADTFGFDSVLHPASGKIIRELRKFVPQTKEPALSRMTGVKAPKPSKTTIADIEMTRRRVINWINSASNDADRKLAGGLKDRLDDWLDEAVDNALFEGSEDALKNLKAARGLRVEKRLKFAERKKGADPEGKVIQRMIKQDPTPEQTVNWILGANKLGGREVSAGVTKRLKEIFPEGTPEWDILRETAWLRLTSNRQGDVLSPNMIKSNLNEFLYKNPTLAKTMFTPEEIGVMRELKVALIKTVTPKDLTNPSKTAFTIMRILRDLVRRSGTAATFSGHHFMGGGLFTIGRLLPGNFTSAQGASMAKKAISGVPKYGPRSPGPVAGGVAAGQLINEGETP